MLTVYPEAYTVGFGVYFHTALTNTKEIKMYAIHTFEQWQVIGFNRDNTQHKICTAHSLLALMSEFTKYLQRADLAPVHREVLDSFKAIKVWNIDQGFTGLELPKV